MWWIIGYALVGLAGQTKPWLKHLSFQHDLDDLALSAFRLHDDIRLVQENIPILGDLLNNVRPETIEALAHPATAGSVAALAIMAAGALSIVARKVRPE
jgi:hypothetical protein